MFLNSRTLQAPKDLEFPHDYEDAAATDLSAGKASIADGVSSAMFSGRWARILVEAVNEDPPNSFQCDALREWLSPSRIKWKSTIDYSKLAHNQITKLVESGGGYSTLLWVSIEPDSDDDQPLDEATDQQNSWTLNANSIGDCQLFIIRDGVAVCSFPQTSSAEFDIFPSSIGSRRSKADENLDFRQDSFTCFENDVIVLCTDAAAVWLMEQLEAEKEPDWDRLWDVSEEEWIEELTAQRNAQTMRRDDTTIVLLRVGVCVTEDEVPSDTEIDSLPAEEVVDESSEVEITTDAEEHEETSDLFFSSDEIELCDDSAVTCEQVVEIADESSDHTESDHTETDRAETDHAGDHDTEDDDSVGRLQLESASTDDPEVMPEVISADSTTADSTTIDEIAEVPPVSSAEISEIESSDEVEEETPLAEETQSATDLSELAEDEHRKGE